MITKDAVKTIAARVLRAKNLDPGAAVEQLVNAYVDEAFVGATAEVLEEFKVLAAGKRQEVMQTLREGFWEALAEYAAELTRPPGATAPTPEATKT